jgi:hypothetical protein
VFILGCCGKIGKHEKIANGILAKDCVLNVEEVKCFSNFALGTVAECLSNWIALLCSWLEGCLGGVEGLACAEGEHSRGEGVLASPVAQMSVSATSDEQGLMA